MSVSVREFREGFRAEDVAVVEEYERYDSARDGGIGDVEYRLEEEELLPAYEWDPVGPDEAEEREVEHVNHLAEEERSVASGFGEDGGDLGWHRVVEDQSVEHAVEDVACGSGCYKGEAHDVASGD